MISRYIGEHPAIGIRPVIDARRMECLRHGQGGAGLPRLRRLWAAVW